MDADSIAHIYDQALAGDWNRRLLAESQRVAFERETLAKLLHKANTWLDVACGSGYFLSQFPEVKRAGFDVSPSMVQKAKESNPTAEFIKVGDYRHNVPEWEGQWGLVSSMWQAYNYVNDLDELELVIANLASWTAQGGTCFVPCGAPIGQQPPFPYRRPAKTGWGGTVVNRALIWSWEDENTGALHENLIEPHPDYMVELFERHFAQVELLRYPAEGVNAIIAHKSG